MPDTTTTEVAPAVIAALVGAGALLANGLLVVWAQHAARRLANVQAQTTLDTAAAASHTAIETERAATLELSRKLREEHAQIWEAKLKLVSDREEQTRRELRAVQHRLEQVEIENRDLRILLMNNGITPETPRSRHHPRGESRQPREADTEGAA